MRLKRYLHFFLTLLAVSLAPAGRSQTNRGFDAARPELSFAPRGNFSNNVARPLRYWPINGDFVITNGAEFFNRPLYGLNSGFRIDGGDKPEFSLYLPGRGGNLRLGLKTAGGLKWLNDAAQIVARYRPGSLLYEIRDPLLGEGELALTALPLSASKGLILRARLADISSSSHVELIFAYGGVNGMRGQRGGDIGCEREPVAQFFQLRPEQCRDNTFAITSNRFVLRSKTTNIAGTLPPATRLRMADAQRWSVASDLIAASNRAAELPVLTGTLELEAGREYFFALQPFSGDDQPEAADLAQLFSAAEAHRRTIAERVFVETPDPFINAAAAALNVAADAIWDDKQQSYMHGAVAWRTRLLGWRGQYAGDTLGWHDRTAAHFAGFARTQNTNPVPDQIPPADEQFNLARSEAAIHSNGDLSKNHYDMNLVGVDAFFRHLLWTGDTNYAQAMWPVIERHFAWERRLFRREFGGEKLPLYEAYAAIWASDDLNYNGGGTAHASAYNYFANTLAARVAKNLGLDSALYEREADLILRGMNQHLWLADAGNFAESKDLLGRQLVHPYSGLWTFYHTLDSEVPTPAQAWQMARWIEEHIAHIPIRGANVPEENLFTLPATSWMPYQWSLNNVVMAEAAHTALGFWQADRPGMAFQLFKGELLDSMFLGLCPGNLGCLTSHDMARGEAQRDFADAVGINSRALVEGLFGIKPDALAGELKIVPGFPAAWDHAILRHPDLNFEFRRDALQETFLIEPTFSRPMKLKLQITARRKGVEILVNGKIAGGKWQTNGPGGLRLEIQVPAQARSEMVVRWQGDELSPSSERNDGLRPGALARRNRNEPGREAGAPREAFDWNQKPGDMTKLEPVNLSTFFNDKVTQIFRNEYRSPRSPFASLAQPKQGIGGWCEPNANFDVDDSGLRESAARNGGKIVLPNGIFFTTPGTAEAKNILFTSQWDNYPREVSVPLTGKSSHAFLLMAGSTDAMKSRFDNGEVIATYADGTTTRLALNNPVNWWPIDQDYFMDDFAFRRDEPIPPRVDLRSGHIRLLTVATFKGRGGKVPGGAATVLDLPLDATKELKSLTVRALANEVVIGLMSVTLAR